MPRKQSSIAPGWWDYTTLDSSLIEEAARLEADDLVRLSRPGFQVVLYDTLEEFYLAEALEYVNAWRQSTSDRPVGICGPGDTDGSGRPHLIDPDNDNDGVPDRNDPTPYGGGPDPWL